MSRPLLRAAVALLACAGTAGLAAPTAGAATLDLVLAGDSYTSGNGAGGPYAGGACTRSPKAWGELYAGSLRSKGFTVNVDNVACSGGVVKDLDGQIGAITPQTDLVAVTIGGNDVGFKDIVINCFAPVVFDPNKCRGIVEKGKAKVPAVTADAQAALARTRAKLRPGAKIIVISYPYLANPGSYTLRTLLGGTYNAGKGARELGDLGDRAIIDAADRANAAAGEDYVTFVKTKDLFAGHEPNQDPYVENSATWVWEFGGVGAINDVYHPKPAGHSAIRDAVLRAAGSRPDFGLAG